MVSHLTRPTTKAWHLFLPLDTFRFFSVPPHHLFFRKKFCEIIKITSRDRPKSAPYQCQVFSFTVLENQKFFEKITYSKKWTWRAKVSQCRKTERGTLWDFLTSILSQNIKKMQGDPSGKIFFEKKVSQCQKK